MSRALVLLLLAAVPSELEECRPRNGLPHFVAKCARPGAAVRVAYFGGSITAQAGWRPKSLALFQKTWPAARFAEINAALGGTGSDLGYPHVPTFKDYPGGGVVSTSWDSLFLSLDVWKKEYGQDEGTRKSSRAAAAATDLLLVTNPSSQPAVVALRGEFEDLAGRSHRGSITLEPYASAVLLRRGGD